MRVLKSNSDFAKRVENVMQAMEENNVMIEFCAGEFRFTDTTQTSTITQVKILCLYLKITSNILIKD